MDFYAHGKLLLTGEYLVMHGGLALAIPTSRGQKMQVKNIDEPVVHWRSIDDKGECWFEGRFNTSDFTVLEGESRTAETLVQIFSKVRELHADFLQDSGAEVITTLEFPRDWGLGSSSTLVSLIAQWSGADPYKLQFEVFGGSAYDIACATAEGPLIYKLVNGNPVYELVDFNPPFSDKIWFVYSGSKMNSREAIQRIDLDEQKAKPWLNTLVHLTMQLRFCIKLSDFEQHLRKHEEVLGALTGQTPVQLGKFQDFPGVIKSLGAWGGDFLLATGEEEQVRDYFGTRGLETVLSYKDMIGR